MRPILFVFLLAGLLPGRVFLGAGASVRTTRAEPSVLHLDQLAKEAVRKGQSEITVSPGVYRLPPHAQLRDIHDLTIYGTDVRLLPASEVGNGLTLFRCNNLTLSGFTFDYDPLPFTQGTIVSRSSDGLSFDFAINAGYPALEKKFVFRHVLPFDGKTRRWKEGVPDMVPSTITILCPTRGQFTYHERFRGWRDLWSAIWSLWMCVPEPRSAWPVVRTAAWKT